MFLANINKKTALPAVSHFFQIKKIDSFYGGLGSLLCVGWVI